MKEDSSVEVTVASTVVLMVASKVVMWVVELVDRMAMKLVVSTVGSKDEERAETRVAN